MAVEAAERQASGVPPSSSQMAEAAMAVAVPTSAWQPPSAPETEALRATIAPMAQAFQSARARRSSSASAASATARSDPGMTPAEPAVGAATMTPIEAERSRTAIA